MSPISSTGDKATKFTVTRVVGCAGLVVGILDLTFAFIFYGLRNGSAPIRILHTIASGLLGEKAYRSGLTGATLGLAIHFLIAFVVAGIYVAASRKLLFLTQRPVSGGLLYGLGVFLMMNLVVVPLSAVPSRPPSPTALLAECAGHMFLIGLPIALIARQHAALRWRAVQR